MAQRKKTKKVTKKTVDTKPVDLEAIHKYTQDSVFRTVFELLPDTAEAFGEQPDEYWRDHDDEWDLVTSCLKYVARTCVPNWNPRVNCLRGEDSSELGLVKVQFETVVGCQAVISFMKDSDTVGLIADVTAFYTFNECGEHVMEMATYEVRTVAELRDVVEKACREAKAKALRAAADSVESKK